MQWKLDPAEVAWGAAGGFSGKRRKHPNRKFDLTQSTVLLWHVPTGLSVTGEVPIGHYSKKEMQLLRKRLYPQLYARLEKLVAKHAAANPRHTRGF
jgi:hypothetical protein